MDSGAFAREPNVVLTLGDATALALARSPELGVFPHELREADARLLQAGLQARIPNCRSRSRSSAAGASAAASTRRKRRFRSASPSSWAVSGPTARRVAALETKTWCSGTTNPRGCDVLREVRGPLRRRVAAQERLALTERLLELSSQAQSAVAQRVQAGRDSPVDVLRADVALAESRIERQKAEKTLAAARHNLAATWGGHTPAFEKSRAISTRRRHRDHRPR